MTEGDLPMPQADGAIKNRPAIILREMPPFGDALLCGVSTQLRQSAKDFDELISPSDADFASSGLKEGSLIRLGLLAVVPRSKIVGSIGSISPERHKRLLQRLSEYRVRFKVRHKIRPLLDELAPSMIATLH
jgi:mRNA interferase MazF